MALDCNFDVSEMFAARESQRSALHARYLNEQFEDVAYFVPYYLKDFVAKLPKKLL